MSQQRSHLGGACTVRSWRVVPMVQVCCINSGLSFHAHIHLYIQSRAGLIHFELHSISITLQSPWSGAHHLAPLVIVIEIERLCFCYRQSCGQEGWIAAATFVD